MLLLKTYLTCLQSGERAFSLEMQRLSRVFSLSNNWEESEVQRMDLLYLQALNSQLQGIINLRRREMEMIERSKKVW